MLDQVIPKRSSGALTDEACLTLLAWLDLLSSAARAKNLLRNSQSPFNQHQSHSLYQLPGCVCTLQFEFFWLQ
jgi:hypothetical protein